MNEVNENDELLGFEFRNYYSNVSKSKEEFYKNRTNLLKYAKERINAIKETKEILFYFSDYMYNINSNYIYNKTYLKKHAYDKKKYDTYIEFLKVILFKEKINIVLQKKIKEKFKYIKDIDYKEFYKLNIIFDKLWGLRLKKGSKNIHYNLNDLKIDYKTLSSKKLNIMVEYQYKPHNLKPRVLNYNLNIEKEIKKLIYYESFSMINLNIKNNECIISKINHISNEIKEDIVNFYELTRRYEK